MAHALLTEGEASSFPLRRTNKKYSVGVYHSLTGNFTLLAELTDVTAESHNGVKNDSSDLNVCAYRSL